MSLLGVYRKNHFLRPVFLYIRGVENKKIYIRPIMNSEPHFLSALGLKRGRKSNKIRYTPRGLFNFTGNYIKTSVLMN